MVLFLVVVDVQVGSAVRYCTQTRVDVDKNSKDIDFLHYVVVDMHEELVQVLVLEGTQQTHQTGFGPLALEQAEELVEEAVEALVVEMRLLKKKRRKRRKNRPKGESSCDNCVGCF